MPAAGSPGTHLSRDQDENDIFQIREDREGSLWLATGKGIARFADGAFERYDRENGLTDNAVQDILIDKEGSIWVSTFGGGVDRFRDEKFVTYSSKVGLSYDNVESVIEDRTGAIWIGTSFGGLNRLKDGVITVFENTQGLPFVDVRALGEDRQGTIWIGSGRGFHTIRNGAISKVSLTVDGNPNIEPGPFLLKRSGEWLVTSRNKLFLHTGGQIHIRHIHWGRAPREEQYQVPLRGQPRDHLDFHGRRSVLVQKRNLEKIGARAGIHRGVGHVPL